MTLRLYFQEHSERDCLIFNMAFNSLLGQKYHSSCILCRLVPFSRTLQIPAQVLQLGSLLFIAIRNLPIFSNLILIPSSFSSKHLYTLERRGRSQPRRSLGKNTGAEKQRCKPKNSLFTIENKGRAAGGKVGGRWARSVMGIEEGTCEEHQALDAS